MSPSRSAVEESPESSPIPPPPPSMSPLFQPPAEVPASPKSSPPNQPDQPSPSPLPSDAAPSWSTSEPSDPSSGPAESSDTPSTGKGLKVSKAGMRVAIGSGFRQVCKVLASVVATAAEREYEVWRPDDEDVKDVAEPAANLVYRRLPDDAKSGDLLDLMQLGMAVLGYLGKTARRRAELRTALRLQETAGVEETQPQTTFTGGGF